MSERGWDILYVDASAGVSSDMLLAALIDLGLPLSKLRRALNDLGLSNVHVRVNRVKRQGIRAAWVSIAQRSSHPQLPRQAGQVIDFIRRSKLHPPLKARMVRVMTTLAQAEGKVHHLPWRKVRFHQVGRLDTWVNFIGFSLGLIHFRIEKLFVSPIPVGTYHEGHDGKGRSFPGPATRQLLKPFETTPRREPFEWTTPTGAALLSAFGTPEPAPPFRVVGIGHGVGHHPAPSGSRMLRLLLGIVK